MDEPIDPAFARVVEAFGGHAGVTRGRMMSSLALKVNGKIFAMFDRNQFVTKLPKARVDELVSAAKGRRFDPGQGRPMKEWIAMEHGTADRVALSREAYEFVKRGSVASKKR